MKKRSTLTLFTLVILLWSCQPPQVPKKILDSKDYDKAVGLLSSQPDSAFYYFNKLVSITKDSLLIARAYCNMGRIQTDAGDHYGAQESLTQGLKYLNERRPDHHRCLTSTYNELGIASTNLKNYEQALEFLNEALHFSKEPGYREVILNNKANVFRKTKAYAAALSIYQDMLPLVPKNGPVYARILTNMVTTHWRKNPQYNPAPELLTALSARVKHGDWAGVNSSYAHLTDYYVHANRDSALHYAEKWHQLARKLHSPEDEMDAIATLIKLNPNSGAQLYFDRYQRINDSLQTARNRAKSQFALVRYQTEKHKADKLLLQKENSERQVQILRQQIGLAGAGLLLIGGSISALFWYRRRKLRLEQEAQEAIRTHQLQTSQKVHDVVANGLYQVMTEVDYRDDLTKEELLDKIELLYHQSRDISYEPKAKSKDFAVELGQLLTSFGNDRTRVAVLNNEAEIWQAIEEDRRQELKYILQELLVNMKKHSQATTVLVKFELKNNHLVILYTDNGVGLPEKVILGNGLRSTGNRIAGLNGTLTFEREAGEGLHLQLSVPVIQSKSYV